LVFYEVVWVFCEAPRTCWDVAHSPMAVPRSVARNQGFRSLTCSGYATDCARPLMPHARPFHQGRRTFANSPSFS
jgi:hypothetical protein